LVLKKPPPRAKNALRRWRASELMVATVPLPEAASPEVGVVYWNCVAETIAVMV